MKRIRLPVRFIVLALALLAGATGVGYAVFTKLQFVRLTSQDNSVRSSQIAAAVRQIFKEWPERVFLDYDDMVGPSRYIKSLISVTDEDYHELFPIRADFDELAVTMRAGHKVVFLFLPVSVPDDHTRAPGLMVRQMPDGKIVPIGKDPDSRSVAAYQAWFARQKRSDGVHVTSPPQGGRFETTWRDGRPDGPFRAYYADGKLWAEATYVRGEVSGRHVLYDRTGKVIHDAVFAPWRRAQASR